MSKFKCINRKDEILALYDSGKDYLEIAKQCYPEEEPTNMAQNVRRLILRFGNPRKRESMLSPYTESIEGLIKEGKHPKELAQLYSVKEQTMVSFIRSKFPNVSFLPSKGNVHYFHSIDSYAKAYIVGFIAADGSLVRNAKDYNSYTLTITVKYEDGDVLRFIKSQIGNEHNLLDIVRPCTFNPDKIIHHLRYCISDSSITEDLNTLGIFPNKSLTMSDIIDNIPYQYRDAFIIGYFDGDGSVTARDGLFKKPTKRKAYPDNTLYVSFRGTVPFLTGVCRHLGISSSHIHQYDKIASLSFASKKDVIRLFKCYDNLSFYYKRKYDVFLKRINHPSFDKYR